MKDSAAERSEDYKAPKSNSPPTIPGVTTDTLTKEHLRSQLAAKPKELLADEVVAGIPLIDVSSAPQKPKHTASPAPCLKALSTEDVLEGTPTARLASGIDREPQTARPVDKLATPERSVLPPTTVSLELEEVYGVPWPGRHAKLRGADWGALPAADSQPGHTTLSSLSSHRGSRPASRTSAHSAPLPGSLPSSRATPVREGITRLLFRFL